MSLPLPLYSAKRLQKQVADLLRDGIPGGMYHWGAPSTMYKDIYLLEPVTAVGDTVAAIHDIAFGYPLRDEVRVLDFYDGWVRLGGGSGGIISPTSFDVTGGGGYYRDIGLTTGVSYQVVISYEATLATGLTLYNATSAIRPIGSAISSIANSITAVFVAEDPNLYIRVNAATTINITGILIAKLVSKSPILFQSTATARGIYSVDAGGHGTVLTDGIDDRYQGNMVGGITPTLFMGNALTRSSTNVSSQAMFSITANSGGNDYQRQLVSNAGRDNAVTRLLSAGYDSATIPVGPNNSAPINSSLVQATQFRAIPDVYEHWLNDLPPRTIASNIPAGTSAGTVLNITVPLAPQSMAGIYASFFKYDELTTEERNVVRHWLGAMSEVPIT